MHSLIKCKTEREGYEYKARSSPDGGWGGLEWTRKRGEEEELAC